MNTRTFPVKRLLALACVGACSAAAAGESDVAQRGTYSLEDLLKVEVVTASRKSQDLLDVPAAVFVLTHDDIVRSGATSLPDALRLVPGVQVARVSSGTWAVSVRGSNDRFSDKLQVLVDGRSVYSPLFAGVFWEAELVPLQEIDRIEIVRGPGAAAWGANAVNGVINIITRRPGAVLGGAATVSAGERNEGSAFARYATAPAPGWAARLWAQQNQDNGATTNIASIHDSFSATGAGAEIERDVAGVRRTMRVSEFDSDVDYGIVNAALNPPYAIPTQADQEYRTSTATYREERVLSADSNLAWQLSAEHSDLAVVGVRESRTTYDADLQHQVRWAPTHELVWGAALKYSQNQLSGAFPIDFVQGSASDSTASVFAQDEWRLRPRQFTLSYGLRVDRSSFNDSVAVQPNVCAWWTPAAGHTVWTSLARANRLPAQAEYAADITLRVIPPNAQSPLPVEVRNVAQPASQSRDEALDMVEAGYRGEWFGRTFVDVAAFAGRYRNLRSSLPLASYLATNPLRYVQATQTAWHVQATTSGLELAIDWRLARDWRWVLTASHLELHADRSSASDTEAALIEGTSPKNQVGMRLAWNPAPAYQIDLSYLRVGALPALDVPAYDRVDLRWAWQVARNVELALVGQNIGNAAHAEFVQTYLSVVPTQVRNTWYARLDLQF